MSVFLTSFTTPASYTISDPLKIGVSGGLGILEEDLTNVYARYHLNESSGTNAPDDSGNGRNGTLVNMENGDWVPGKLGNGLVFDGTNESVDCGSNASFERTQAFSVECWFKTSTPDADALVCKMQTSPLRGWQVIMTTGGAISFMLKNTTSSNELWVRTISLWNNNTWHHALITYDGSSFASGVKIYINGSSQTLTISTNNLTSTIINSGNLFLASRQGSQLMYTGSLDECVVYDKELSSDEAIHRYNSGSGREDFIRYPDSPTIYKTAGNSDDIFSWDAFTVIEGTVEGSLRFQLSSNGAIWYYWDGGAWAVVGASDYNTKATINTNIGSFPTAPDKVYVKSFLISDGFQQVEINEIQINYTSNQLPLVNAGGNKNAKDNETIKPFSDCSFSDPDGTIDFVRYKVNGELDVWTNIPKGAYATLLEATQDLDYQFNNTGALNVQLQVEDNLGATTDDNLTVTVTQYTRTVNIRHPVTNEHIAAIDFNPGDGGGSDLQNSPFVYSWDGGIVELIMASAGYYSKVESVLMNTEADLDLTMEAISYVNECKASVGLITDSDTLVINTWLLKSGVVFATPTSCVIDFKDKNGDTVYTDSSNSPGADGVFKFENSPSGLTNEGVYRIESSIVVNGTTYTTVIPVNKIQRDQFSLDGKVYIDTVNGVTGTIYPKGTFNQPVNNWADAKVIADANFIKRFIIRGSLTFTNADNISGYEFSGDTSADVIVILQGANTEKTVFNRVEISGQVNGHVHIMDHSCVKNMTDFQGEIHNSGLNTANLALISDSSKTVLLSGCWSEVPGSGTPVIDMGGNGPNLNFRAYSGGIKLINKTGNSSVTLEFIAGQYKLTNTVTGGYITIRGVVKEGQDDSASGCTVNKTAAISNPSFWAETLADNQVSDSFGELIQSEALGKWVLDVDSDPMTLTKYKTDNVTVLKQFTLGTVVKNVQPVVSRTPV